MPLELYETRELEQAVEHLKAKLKDVEEILNFAAKHDRLVMFQKAEADRVSFFVAIEAIKDVIKARQPAKGPPPR